MPAAAYPRTLLDGGTVTKSERRVFERLRDGLDEPWEIFHSVSWIARDHAEGSEDGEIDFVLAHPERGIVCLEVKGGGIECIGGQWHRTYRGERQSIEDPFKQALDHRYDLARKLAQADRDRWCDAFIVHALVFPMVTIHQLTLAPDAPREILLDRHDLDDPSAAIGRVLAYHQGSRDKRKAPGPDGIQALRDVLAPEVRIKVPMAAEFIDEEEALITLTHDQASLLGRFGRDKRMVVTGCAGSGKTMLAVEQAKRAAGTSDAVLFVCFNRALVAHLRRTEAKSGISFQTFHGLCTQLAHRAGIELPSYPRDETPQSFWSDELPHALIEATEELGAQFDSLFVDEAQDLHNDWLEALLTTLRDPGEAQVWLFMDDNQRVYEQLLDVPGEFRPFDLSWNCRNTQAIHAEVIKKYAGEVEPEALGPPGRPVELYRSADQAEAVREVVARLLGEEEVLPQDLVVLSSHNPKRSETAARGLPAPYRYVDAYTPTGPNVRFSSIRAFKGLEAPVVVLCELEDLDEASMDKQLYVAMSRAKNHCVVVAPA